MAFCDQLKFILLLYCVTFYKIPHFSIGIAGEDTTIFFQIITPTPTTDAFTSTEISTETVDTSSEVSSSTAETLNSFTSASSSDTEALSSVTQRLFRSTESRNNAKQDLNTTSILSDENFFRKSYSGYSVLSIEPAALEHLYVVLRYEQKYNFLSHRRILEAPLRVLIPPGETEMRQELQEKRIPCKILAEDVKIFFDEERMNNARAQPSLIGISFNRYLRYDFIMKYLKRLSKVYSEIVTVIKIGETVEKKDIVVVQISHPSFSSKKATSILLEAGMHGREWLSVTLTLFAINQLVEHSAANLEMLRGIVWYVLPILNADGYEYAQRTDRLWKTNREPSEQCYGVDLDRNFAVGIPEKKSSCTDLFPGEAPGSEPETEALENFIMQATPTAYLSIHSGDAFIAQPWGYTVERTTDYDLLESISTNMKNAMEQHDNSSRFIVGSLSSICGVYSGAAVDWAKQHGVAFSLMLSLRGAEGEGFDVSNENIYENVAAGFRGLQALSRDLQAYRMRRSRNDIGNGEITNKCSSMDYFSALILISLSLYLYVDHLE